MEIVSPNYPNNYEPDTDCSWTFVEELNIEHQRLIQLTVEQFSVQGGDSDSCAYDYIQVDEPNKEPVKYCDYASVHSIPIRSTSNSLTLTFHSDGSLEDQGFKISYKSIGT